MPDIANNLIFSWDKKVISYVGNVGNVNCIPCAYSKTVGSATNLKISKNKLVEYNGILYLLGGSFVTTQNAIDGFNGEYLSGENIFLLSSIDGHTWNRSQDLNFNDPVIIYNNVPLQYFDSVVFDDKVWMTGGKNDNDVYEKVWNNIDGIAVNSAPWGKRYSHAMSVYDSRMWISGGLDNSDTPQSDIWYSSDGINWSLSATSLSGVRFDHAMVAYNGGIYVVGGSSSLSLAVDPYRDIWYTSDGVTWAEVEIPDVMSSRFGRDMRDRAFVFDKKMYIIFEGNEIWYTDNGTDWVTASLFGAKFNEFGAQIVENIGFSVNQPNSLTIATYNDGIVSVGFDDSCSSKDFIDNKYHASAWIGDSLYLVQPSEWSYVALVEKQYKNSRIIIHTDSIEGDISTGHANNPASFWRKMFEYVSGKTPRESIVVGGIERKDIANVTPTQVTCEDILYWGGTGDTFSPISGLDILYLSGDLCEIFFNNSDARERLAYNIESFLSNGKGVVIERPTPSLEISVDYGGIISELLKVDRFFVYSDKKPINSIATWTTEGASSYMYDPLVQLSFQVAIRNIDLPDGWNILMSSIENAGLVTSDLSEGSTSNIAKVHSGFFGKANSEFGVGYTCATHKGTAVIETGDVESSSSESSSSSSESYDSSSSSSAVTNWNLCDNIVMRNAMTDNEANPIVRDLDNNNYLHMGIYTSVSNPLVLTNSRHSTGKLDGSFDMDPGDVIFFQPNTFMNFVDQWNEDLPFSVSFWAYFNSVGSEQVILNKVNSWKLVLSATGILSMTSYLTPNDYKGVSCPAGTISVEEWKLIVVTCDYDSNFKIFVNAVRKDNAVFSQGGYTHRSKDSTRFNISDSVKSALLKIEQFTLYDKQLSQLEIDALWNRSAGTRECSGEYRSFSPSLRVSGTLNPDISGDYEELGGGGYLRFDGLVIYNYYLGLAGSWFITTPTMFSIDPPSFTWATAQFASRFSPYAGYQGATGIATVSLI